MAFGFRGRLASPERVARGIRRAADGGSMVQYVPGYWRGIMIALRMLPPAIFHRLEI
jgi:hypothetical protein